MCVYLGAGIVQNDVPEPRQANPLGNVGQTSGKYSRQDNPKDAGAAIGPVKSLDFLHDLLVVILVLGGSNVSTWQYLDAS